MTERRAAPNPSLSIRALISGLRAALRTVSTVRTQHEANLTLKEMDDLDDLLDRIDTLYSYWHERRIAQKKGSP